MLLYGNPVSRAHLPESEAWVCFRWLFCLRLCQPPRENVRLASVPPVVMEAGAAGGLEHEMSRWPRGSPSSQSVELA